MKKRFRAYSSLNINLIKIILYFLIFILAFILTIKLLFKSNIDSDNLLNISTNNYNLSLKDIASLNNPDNILKMSFSNLKNSIPPKEETVNKLESNPLVYIYNTHQTEEYNAGSLKNYNIIPTVYMASNILKKSLANYGIESIVEDEQLTNVLKKNNWNYNESYKVSMLWLNRAKEKYPTLKYFIDLHRDSSTLRVTIDDKVYAKMMFVIGMNHPNYEENEKLVLKLNTYLNNNYEGLMRSIFYGKRSEYNQGFDPNTFLVEVGGVDNYIDEVYNSIQVLAEAISSVIGESNGN